MAFVKRSISSGKVRLAQVGETIHLNGWAHKVRDLGGVSFVDLRDRTGLVQLVFNPANHPNAGTDIRNETCLSISGIVRERAEGTKNSKMATGEIEVEVTSYEVSSPSKPLPFPVSD